MISSMSDPHVTELVERLRTSPRVRAVGAGTKPALSSREGVEVLELSRLRGIIEYEPGEFTFTARAGTPLREISAALAAHGQYLPFDPPLEDAGATLGGTIAAGLNGPGRLRYGGLRDFILGVTFLTGDGRLVKGGGKVVKNAAGFDFPKLMVGSCGRLGIILEATFKVFPAPEATLTAAQEAGSLPEALDLLGRLVRAPLDLDALELEPPGRLTLRLAGDAGTLERRLERLNRELGCAFGGADAGCWENWAGQRPVKVPLTPAHIPRLDARLERLGLERRYGVAGHVGWVTAESGPDVEALHRVLQEEGLSGMALCGERARLGAWNEPPERLVARVLDPQGRLA